MRGSNHKNNIYTSIYIWGGPSKTQIAQVLRETMDNESKLLCFVWVYSLSLSLLEGATIGLIARTESIGNKLDKVIKHHSLHRPPLGWNDTGNGMFWFVEPELRRGKFFTWAQQLHHLDLLWLIHLGVHHWLITWVLLLHHCFSSR